MRIVGPAVGSAFIPITTGRDCLCHGRYFICNASWHVHSQLLTLSLWVIIIPSRSIHPNSTVKLRNVSQRYVRAESKNLVYWSSGLLGASHGELRFVIQDENLFITDSLEISDIFHFVYDKKCEIKYRIYSMYDLINEEQWR